MNDRAIQSLTAGALGAGLEKVAADMPQRVMLAMMKVTSNGCDCEVCQLLREGARAMEAALTAQLLAPPPGPPSAGAEG